MSPAIGRKSPGGQAVPTLLGVRLPSDRLEPGLARLENRPKALPSRSHAAWSRSPTPSSATPPPSKAPPPPDPKIQSSGTFHGPLRILNSGPDFRCNWGEDPDSMS